MKRAIATAFTRTAFTTLIPIALATSAAHAQSGRAPGDPVNTGTAGSARVVAGKQYDEASDVWRFFFGANWRSTWSAAINAPILDLTKFAGGLTAYKSGGNQTKTLHLKGADGRHYVFRSVPKSVQQSLGPDLKNTAIGDIVQDQNSANHPGSITIADAVQRATGVLHTAPQLFVMPDDERLGEFRKMYGNMLGHLELKADDVEDGVTQFDNADKIQDADKLLENLESSMEYRLDTRAYLKVRLVDAIMGDFDRGADQWDFARHDKDGLKTYTPIARDRDWAFMHSDGAVMKAVRNVYGKIGSFDQKNEKLRSITFMTHEFDRSHLVTLPWTEWQAVVAELQAGLTNDAIETAVNAQPPEYAKISADPIRTGLRARRDALPELAREFYERVNGYADVFAANGSERADIERNADGSLTVRLTRLKKDGEPAKEGYAFDRTFLPHETDEVRVYMQEGNDQVSIHGTGPAIIKLRVTGGAGDDVITDASTASSGNRTEIYDPSGNNRITPGPLTDLHTGMYVTGQPTTLDPEPKEKPKAPALLEERRGHFQDQWRLEGADFATQRTQSISTRFWGNTTGLSGSFDMRDGAGVILGAGVKHTSYGFRSEPYAARITSHLMFATGAQRLGADASGIWHPAERVYTLTARALASGYESQLFYGFGNNSPLISERAALIMRNELLVESAITWPLGPHSSFSVGPVLRLVDPRVPTLSPAGVSGAPGTRPFGGLGAQSALALDRTDHRFNPHTGYRVGLTYSAFGAVENGDGIYGKATGTVSAYIPLSSPTLALRLGGLRAFGDFPLQDAVRVGGRYTVRGFRWDRFTGDTGVFGNAEIRAPITRAELLVRGDVGLILLADAGRVWMDGVSSGGWHHSLGGGVSFSSLSKAVSLTYARGEESRLYLNLGLPF